MLADTVGFPLPNNFQDVEQIKKFQKPILKLAGTDWDPTKPDVDDKEDNSSEVVSK